MATYHLSVQSISRGAGRSLVAATAYRTCSRMTDQRTGLIHDYRRKGGHVAGGFTGWSTAPEGWANAAERAERHPRAQTAREIVIALPRELTTDEHRALVVGFAEWLRDRHGVAIRWDIHRPRPPDGAADNPHAHLLLTTRQVTDDRRFTKKTRELDTRTTSRTHIRAWRQEWEQAVNAALRAVGHATQVDCRSLRARAEAAGLPSALTPLTHLGPAAAAMERRGDQTARGDNNRKARRFNGARRALLNEWLGNEAELVSLRPLVRQDHRKRRTAVAEAVAAFRDVSITRPRPVRERAEAYAAMIDAAQRAWPRSWPRCLSRLLRRSWPEGPRVAATVGRRLSSAALLAPSHRAAAELLGLLLDPPQAAGQVR